MRVHSATITGLFGRERPIECVFHDDLTILTGRNGAGKTTTMKLIWYVISGNMHLALSEIAFRTLRLTTSEYELDITRVNENTCKGRFTNSERTYEIEDIIDPEDDIVHDARDKVNALVLQFSGSVFFPTFRRIEGGFSLQNNRNTAGRNAFFAGFQSAARNKNEVETGLALLSRNLTNKSHLFVSSISTDDIVRLLLDNFSNLSQQASVNQQASYQGIINQIAKREAEQSGAEKAELLLSKISEEIEKIQVDSKKTMLPFDTLSELVEKIFQSQSIQIGSRLSLGDAANALSSEALSAGEKQMLSFVCYNAFFSNTVFFIDEPELSLHVDWQRQLFPILLAQGTDNQYVICTHSPFIYSKYPEKEIAIDADRGDNSTVFE